MLPAVVLTPTLQKLWELFSDGGAYSFPEVVRHLGNGTEESAIRRHISHLRTAIAPHGLSIVLHYRGPFKAPRYQLMRRVTSGE